MTWFHVDDGFWSHPKTLGMSLATVGVWTLAGSWCAQHLTDGYIPADALAMVCRRNPTRQAQELVERHLWTTVADGWQFVDWLDWQKSRAEVEASRQAAKERTRRWRDGKAVTRHDTRHINVGDAYRDASPIPSLPNPALPSTTGAPVGPRASSTYSSEPTPCEHGSEPRRCALCRHRTKEQRA